jgi:hypothetical protein
MYSVQYMRLLVLKEKERDAGLYETRTTLRWRATIYIHVR